jgi:hypothetical protein
MNETMELFLMILRSALKDQRPELDRDIPTEQWQALFRLADIHKLLPLVYEAVQALPSLDREQALLADMKQKVRCQVIAQTLRTGEFLTLNDRLQEAGIRPLVVKGIVCRNLYPKPDHRLSSDEDLLVPAGEFERCHRVLTEFGMATTEPAQNLESAFELPYRKEGSPLYIELHKQLFAPGSEAYGHMNRFFERVHERAVTMDIQGHRVYTMDPTDHLFYLLCHALKHFLHSGFGIRQVCDISLFANAYGDRVDWLEILENCKAIRAEKFAAAVFRIGSNHLVFDPEKAAYPSVWAEIEVDELPMLTDLLSGGLYGDSSMSRKHSSNITLDAVAAQKTGGKTKNAWISSVFPSAAKLEGRYSYLKKHPHLLPVAWFNRLWNYGKEIRRIKDDSAADALKIGNKRLDLLKTYGVLD